MATIQFKRSPTNILAFCDFYANRHRTLRSVNQIDGNVMASKEAELKLIHGLDAFQVVKISKSTFLTLLELVFVDMVPIVMAEFKRIGGADLINQNEEHAIAQLRKLPQIDSSNIWTSFGVLNPSIEKDKKAGVPMDLVENDVVKALVGIGLDQTKTPRNLPTGRLDKADATPKELKAEKDALDAENEANQTRLENGLRVNKSVSIDASDSESDEIVGAAAKPVAPGGVAKAGAKKRGVAKLSVAEQETIAKEKEIELKRLRTAAKSGSGANGGGETTLDSAFSGYLKVATASRESAAKAEARRDEKEKLTNAWAMLTDPQYFPGGEVGVGIVQEYLRGELGVCESSDLKLLEEEHIQKVCTSLKTLSAKKFRGLLVME